MASKIRCNRFFLLGMVFAFMSPFVSGAQENRMPVGESRTLELVDQLKDVVQRAERSRSDPRVIQELRELVRRYDWPWRVSLLYDDFRDGDYTANPAWVVRQGDFWVSQGVGLRSAFDRPVVRPSSDRKSESSAKDLLEGIFRGIAGKPASEVEPPPSADGELYTQLRITNSFALKLKISSRGNPQQGNRLELGPHRGSQRDSGYRLAYEPGSRQAFTLFRVAPGRSAIVEIYDQPVELADGRLHDLEWRRTADGEMIVLLDNKEIIRTLDRAYNDSFDGFSIVNRGGDYAFREIAIFGTQP